MERFTGLIGIVLIFGIAFLMSNNRKAINYRLVLSGIAIQLSLAVFILKVPLGKTIFSWIGDAVTKILNFSQKGAEFVFGPLVNSENMGKAFGSGNEFIFFFDSNGPGAPKEVIKLRDRILDQAKQLGIKLKYDSNENFRHQRGNTECGMYCLFFIISLITETYKYKHFKSSRISDEFMEKLRDVYFNIEL